MRKKRPVKDRFNEKWEPITESGCWIWTGAIGKNGYGNFCLDKKERKYVNAHRLSYFLFKGMPTNSDIDHLCRVRSCVNPDHLESVPHKENSRRGNVGAHHREKTACSNGHELNTENIYRNKNGWRVCKICGRMAGKKSYYKRQSGIHANKYPEKIK